MKREDEEQHGFADPLSVIADLLGENRIDLMMFWARKMPGEAMSLAKQSTKDSSSQRRSLLRYATVMVSREKASFVAWRDEVELVKIEKKEEEERLRREQARQRKMKKPNMNNLNSYEGGKPVAVKTLGHQIASIYQAKAVSDDLMDSNGSVHYSCALCLLLSRQRRGCSALCVACVCAHSFGLTRAGGLQAPTRDDARISEESLHQGVRSQVDCSEKSGKPGGRSAQRGVYVNPCSQRCCKNPPPQCSQSVTTTILSWYAPGQNEPPAAPFWNAYRHD